jgi:hypothetical protein
MTLQRAFGMFPRILGKGDPAKVCQSSVAGTELTLRDCLGFFNGIEHLAKVNMQISKWQTRLTV